MSERVDIRVSEETKETFRQHKREGETWEGLVLRAADALAADADRDQYPGAPRCTDCGAVAHVWTVEDGMLVCGACADGEIGVDAHP